MESSSSTSYTYNVVSIPTVYMLIVNLNHYGHKCLILASPSIAYIIRNAIEWFNRAVKESVKSARAAIPFKLIYK